MAVVELSLDLRSGTARPGQALERILRERGHEVRRLGADPRFLERLRRRERVPNGLAPSRDPDLALADHLEQTLREQPFDVVVARGIHAGRVLERDLRALRVLDWPNVSYIEEYSTSEPDLARVDQLFRRERAVVQAADLVVSSGTHLTQFIERQVPIEGLVRKLITVPLGCDTTSRVARPSATPRIVYAGSYYPIQDPYLLSRLTGLSPFPIDCFGPRAPADQHLPSRLAYRGYAADETFLADYQVGLITVARDRLREVSPATKLPYYLAHGLPVLFPSWMREGHDFPACAMPYEESTFVSQVRQMLEPDRWLRMSEAALVAAEGRRWQRTLGPLVAALESRSNVGPGFR